MINLEETKNETRISKDLANRKIFITRTFNAGVDLVWTAWTERSYLDKWWAPKPWRAETKIMDFREGGKWLYAMIGPDGTTAYCRVDFKTIKAKQSLFCEDYFCDERGSINNDFPKMFWLIEFKSNGSNTEINVTIHFDKLEDLEKIVEMGFEAGFTMGLSNLDELLKTL